jgi:hypothetical protein
MFILKEKRQKKTTYYLQNPTQKTKDRATRTHKKKKNNNNEIGTLVHGQNKQMVCTYRKKIEHVNMYSCNLCHSFYVWLYGLQTHKNLHHQEFLTIPSINKRNGVRRCMMTIITQIEVNQDLF